MKITLHDSGSRDGKFLPFSAYPGLSIDPCGYGTTEAAALEELIDKIDEALADLEDAKAEAMALLNERRLP
jgi:hypothetical protein